MATVDDKVVSMSFDSSKFESGVSRTISSLDKLKSSLKFSDAGKGFDNINAASKRINLGHIAQAVDDIKQKFSAMGIVGIAVLANIATKAFNAGASLVKAFTFGPVIQGFHEYETQLNAVQTILSNTSAAGTKLKDVNKALAELNTYADKTIYNFTEMTRNIGTFTAAGVDLDTAVSSIKGIANLAALSGSNSQQAATAMYQLSQAISAGRVNLQDWNSVVNAGMGGTIFQRALAQTAVHMGTLDEKALKLTGSMKNVTINGQAFRTSIMAAPGKESWLTGKVLTQTLSQLSGNLSDAQLKAEGYTDAQIKAIQTQAKQALAAATTVKTFTQLIDTTKEAIGSGWAMTWQTIFGDFGEAKALFTGLSNVINTFVGNSANARNKILKDWKDLGGRTDLIAGLKAMFQNLGAVLKPIKEAFRDIFPRTTGKELADLTSRFRSFMESVKPSAETIENIKRTFSGLFAILDIGKQIISGIFSVFGHLFGVIAGGRGSFLEFTAGIGDFFVALDKALKKGDGLKIFFEGLGELLAIPLHILGQLAQAIGNLFDGFSPGEFSIKMGSITDVTVPFKNGIEAISEALQGLGPAIGRALSSASFEGFLEVVKVGLFGALVLAIRKFIGGTTLSNLFGKFGAMFGRSFGGGVLKNLGGALGSVTGSLKAMQQQLQAKALKELAIAIALLSASVLALSLVNPKRLGSSLSAMTLLMGELIGAMAVLNKVIKSGFAAKLPFIAGSMILLAAAIDLLTIAVLAMSRLSWNELMKGLAGVGGLLASLSVASKYLSANSAGMIRAGLGITAIAVAMKIFASAMADFGQLSWTEIGKGLVSVAGGLGIMAAAAQAFPKSMLANSIAVIAIAVALKMLADAVAKFGVMDWNTIGKGLAGVGGALAAIAVSMRIAPKSMILVAGGLLLVAVSLSKIVAAVKSLGGTDITTLAKGLVSLGAALAILAVALKAMTGTFAGAAALTVAAIGISLLASALVSLGQQSWESILKSIVALAAGLAIVAAAGLLLSSAVPALLGFGVALVAIGGGLALAGAGIALIGIGLSAIAASGSVAIAVLIQALVDFSERLPEILQNVVAALLTMVQSIAKAAPKFVNAMVTIINSLLNAIIQSAPKIIQAFVTILLKALQAIAAKAPQFVQAGITIFLALINGISKNIGKIVTAGANLIIKFLGAIADKASAIVTAGANVLVKFLDGVARSLPKVITSATNVIIAFIKGVAKNAVRLANAGAKALVDFLNGLAKAIEKYTPQIMQAGVNIGKAIIKGIGKGLANLAGGLLNQVKGIGSSILGKLGGVLSIFSPSKETYKMGIALVQGLALGMSENASAAYDSADKLGQMTISALKRHGKAAKDAGRILGINFGQGLLGSQDDINSVFAQMNSKILEQIKTTRETITGEQAKLKELQKETKPDEEAIAKIEASIQKHQDFLKQYIGAHDLLTGKLKAEKQELLGLAKEYEKIGEQLSEAQQTLDSLISEQQSAITQYAEQYSELPELQPDTEGGTSSLEQYLTDLAARQAAVEKYKATLEALREMGIDDTTYEMLLEQGTSGQQFADELLAAGPDAVTAINTLDTNLTTAAEGLGEDAGASLYDAGIKAAQGVVDGLKAKQGEIYDQMKAIAKKMVKALKEELGIKSPSKEFEKLGRFTMEGMAKGITDSSKTIEKALDKAMGILSGVTDDLSPTITPVLDLSNVKSQARNLGSLFGKSAIMADVSLRQASTISSEQAKAREDVAHAMTGPSFNFEQNNYSPQALSEIEIYRQTRNQLSQLKTALALS